MLSSTLRIILIFAVLLYFVIVLLLLKKKALTLKYTLLWLLAGFCMGILVIFPMILRKLTGLLGIANEMYGLFAIALGFVICLLMALTSIVSRQTAKIRHLVQTLAIMEKRLREAENSDNREP